MVGDGSVECVGLGEFPRGGAASTNILKILGKYAFRHPQLTDSVLVVWIDYG